MTDQLPGRIPPWGTGVWAYQTKPPTQPVRIGDAERDEALDKLGDHFAAGRLTREELDERTDQAIGARFDSDLDALFRDLPVKSREAVVVRRTPSRVPAVLPVAVMALLPLLLLAAVASVILHVPVLIGPVIWLLVLSSMGRRPHHR